MIKQNSPSGLDLESTEAIVGLLRSLASVSWIKPVIFLFCVMKQNLAEESIFHFQNFVGIIAEKHSKVFL